MADFKKIFEDLASGRPAKKPVSGNLLKQRAKENEKALKSGFMKMPDYVKKKFNEEEVKPHKMYKGDKVVVAKNKAEHDKLNKQGYTHDDPKTKKVEEEKKNCGCGQDPCITYGKKQMKEEDGSYYGKPSPRLKKKVKGGKEVVNNPYSKDDGKTVVAKQKKYQPQLSKSKQGVNNVLNFLKKNPDYKIGPHSLKGGKKQMKEAKKPVVHFKGEDKLKTVKIKYNKPIKTKVTDIGPGGKEVVRKDWSESARDNYNPTVAAKRNKERMKKVGLPAESPLVQEEKQKGIDGKVCWKGYKRMGTKKKGGKTVDNCVKVEDFVLDAFENYYLTELSPKTISSYQKKAGKEYSDLKQRTMSATSREGGYHKGYISDKEYNAQHDMAAKKRQRGKGLAMSKGKGVQKEGAMKRLATNKAEADRLNDRAHAAIGYKKTSDTGIQKVKGGYARKRTYTREEQMQLVTNLDIDESISNLVRRGVDKVQKAISDSEKRTGYKVDPAKRNIPNPVSGDNIAKRLYGKSQKKR